MLTVVCCSVMTANIADAKPKKPKNDQNGYYDPRGNYHYYSEDKKSQEGYYDPRGNYHRYDEDKKNDKKPSQGSDIIDTGRRIWDIFK